MGQISHQEKFVAPQPTNPLKEAIFRLCEKEPYAASPSIGIEYSDENEIWTAIRNTVDETVLPRDLILYVDGIAVLRFSVSHRHLNSVQTISTGHAPIKTTPCSARGFADRVRKACAMGQAYVLETAGRGLAPAEPRTGCSGQDLMDALNANGSLGASDDPLDNLKSIAEAIIVTNADGEEVEASGPEAMLQTLRCISATQMKTRRAALPHQLTPEKNSRPSCLLLPFQHDMKIAATEIGSARVFFVAADVLVSSASFCAMFHPHHSAH